LLGLFNIKNHINYGEHNDENRFLTDIGLLVDCLLFDLDVLPPVNYFLFDIILSFFIS